MDKDNLRTGISGEPELIKDFRIPEISEWVAAAEKMLKGGTLDELKSYQEEGIEIEPLYYSGNFKNLFSGITYPAGTPYVNRSDKDRNGNFLPWSECKFWFERDPEKLNHLIISSRDKYRGPLLINFQSNPSEKGSCFEFPKVEVNNILGIERLMNGVEPENREFILFCGEYYTEFYSMLNVYLKKREIAPELFRGYLNADPLWKFVDSKGNCEPVEDQFRKIISIIKDSIRNIPCLKTAGVSTLHYFNSGCSASQEIAFAAATAVEYIETLKKGGVDPAKIVSDMIFNVGTGTEFFTEIAKLRAFRTLWKNITSEYGLLDESNQSTIHSFVSPLYYSTKDLYVNILRAATSALSAVIGGADLLTVHPFDAINKEPSELSKRIAENIPRILGEEAMQKNIIDAAAGSYFIETLTTGLSENAFRTFLEIEKIGGMKEAIRSGFIKKSIDKARKREDELLKSGKRKMIGVNSFISSGSKNVNTGETKIDPDKSNGAEGRINQDRKKKDILLEKLKSELRSDSDNFLRTMEHLFELGISVEEVSSISMKDSIRSEKDIFPEMKRFAEIFEEEK